MEPQAKTQVIFLAKSEPVLFSIESFPSTLGGGTTSTPPGPSPSPLCWRSGRPGLFSEGYSVLINCLKFMIFDKELPLMTSAKTSDFWPPSALCPQIHTTYLTKVAYYVCF